MGVKRALLGMNAALLASSQLMGCTVLGVVLDTYVQQEECAIKAGRQPSNMPMPPGVSFEEPCDSAWDNSFSELGISIDGSILQAVLPRAC